MFVSSEDPAKPFQAPAVIDYGHGQSVDDRPSGQDRRGPPSRGSNQRPAAQREPPAGFNPRPMESRDAPVGFNPRPMEIRG